MRFYRNIKLSFVTCILLFGFSSFSMGTLKMSAVRPHKGSACRSAMGEAKRKVLETCKRIEKALNYKTYKTPFVCDWETLSAKKDGETQHKATIKVHFECIAKK